MRRGNTWRDARVHAPVVRLAAPRVLLVIVVALMASLAGSAATLHLLGSINDPPARVLATLRAHADTGAQPPRPSRRVVVVLIDGMGEAPFESRFPALPGIAWRARLDTGTPSLSRPGYHAIFTGVPAWASGVRYNVELRARNDDLAARVREAGGRVAWMLETVPWLDELFGAPEDVRVLGAQARSAETFARVFREGTALIVVHLTGPDAAGHSHGAESRAYGEAVDDAIAVVATMRARVAEEARASNTIWFVGSDHGHAARGGHGGPEREVCDVSWVALCDDCGVSAVAGRRPLSSLAPTFARALGVAGPRESIADGLDLPFLGAPLHADPARVRAAALARDEEQRATFSRAVLCVGMFLSLLMLSLLFFWRSKRVRFADVLPSSGAAIVFLAFGPPLSFTSARTEDGIAFVAACAAWMVVGAALSWRVVRRRASPVASLASSLLLPAAALAVTGGSLGAWAEPAPWALVLGPAMGLVPGASAIGLAIVEVLGPLAGRLLRAKPKGAPGGPHRRNDVAR